MNDLQQPNVSKRMLIKYWDEPNNENKVKLISWRLSEKTKEKAGSK